MSHPPRENFSYPQLRWCLSSPRAPPATRCSSLLGLGIRVDPVPAYSGLALPATLSVSQENDPELALLGRCGTDRHRYRDRVLRWGRQHHRISESLPHRSSLFLQRTRQLATAGRTALHRPIRQHRYRVESGDALCGKRGEQQAGAVSEDGSACDSGGIPHSGELAAVLPVQTELVTS